MSNSIPEGVRSDICDFDEDFVFNSQTKLNIKRKGLTIKPTLSISDSLFIYYKNERSYVNKKNIFKRIFTWDWARKTTTSHRIEKTNDKLRLEDVLFLEIIN